MSNLQSLIVIRGGTILTVDPILGDIVNGAILIQNGKIVEISHKIDAFNHIEGADFFDAKDAIVMPGIVDAHRHDWMSLFRAATTNETLPYFLINTFYPLGSMFKADHMKAAITVGTLSAINAGTTTVYQVNDCVNTPDHAYAAIAAMQETGIRGIYGYGMQVYAFEPIGFANQLERLACAEQLAKEGLGTDRLEMGMLLSDFGTVPFSVTAMQIKKAHDLGLKYASHTGAARTSVLLRGLRELDDHGLLFPEHLHAHANGLTWEDWKLIAKSGGRVVSTPSSELQMGMGHLPYTPCKEMGIPFAIGTDLVGCSSDGLFTQTNLALQNERMLANDRIHARDTMPFDIQIDQKDALYWMTMGGAKVLGLDHKIGSLTPGKDADLIIIRHKNTFVPVMDPVGGVIQLTHEDDVDTVFIQGKVKKLNGQLLGINPTQVRAEAMHAFNELTSTYANHARLTPQEVEIFWKKAERQADVHFSQAYENNN